jgi:hypothetical protein
MRCMHVCLHRPEGNARHPKSKISNTMGVVDTRRPDEPLHLILIDLALNQSSVGGVRVPAIYTPAAVD